MVAAFCGSFRNSGPVEVCLDSVRQRRGEDPRALAWEREHEAKTWAHMTQPMVVTPSCAACGAPATRIELVAPAEWEQWPATVRACIERQRQPGQWYLLFVRRMWDRLILPACGGHGRTQYRIHR